MNAEVESFFERKKRELGVSLNEVQTQAVLKTDGPLLLLATPGSGKTTTIIMRIGYLISEKGVDPSRIKAVTFSRAAASDMKERFKRFFPDLVPVDFSTIHSLAFEMVREYFWKKRISYRIIEGNVDSEEQEGGETTELPLHKKLILRDLFRALVRERITDDQLEELTTYISYIKNKMLPREKWSSVKCDVKEAGRILLEYERFKQTGHDNLLIDFDDMLTIANEALEEDKGLLRKYQSRYDYVLTDESQDTSLVQHAIVEKLVRHHRNLCVVADDDQSIYSWRGAEPSYLLRFKSLYPRAETLFMERNYRSSRDVVGAANSFIKRNKNRYPKNMFTDNPSVQPPRVQVLADYEHQAKHLVQEVREQINLGEIAVLYRNNSSSIMLMNEFDRAGIPFYMKDSDNRFFKHWVVEDILNFMRLTFSDKRADILEKIHLKLNAYITKQQMAAVAGIRNGESVFDNLLRHAPLKDYQVKLIQDCKMTFRKMQGIAPLEAIRIIRGKLGYEKAIDKMCDMFGFRKDYLVGILNTLEQIADTLGTMEEFAGRLKHLEKAMKSSKLQKGRNAVTFSTFHSSKGLEFERVYMIDLIEGIIPSQEDERGSTAEGKDALMEEAARLFYVGMTRSKVHLELITYRNRDGAKTKESRFVTEVRNIISPPKQTGKPKEAGRGKRSRTSAPRNPNAIYHRKDLVAGKVVKHRIFGRGVILRADEETVEIRFHQELKRLSLQACFDMGLLEPV